MHVNHLGAGTFTIENFLSQQECGRFIAESESLGYEEAAIRTEEGDRLFKDARNNDRIILDSRELSTNLYQRALPFLPAEQGGWLVSGFNERFRYYRYDKQQQFVWHQDGTVRVSPNEESFLTFMIYLNDNFEGGSTDFGWESIRPVQGMALVFPHRLRHQGAVVTSGVKYVLRTDVLYRNSAA
jgi:predicted 2-oxoglutarate/Fe(II)-dependent dioxygenase YbiX